MKIDKLRKIVSINDSEIDLDYFRDNLKEAAECIWNKKRHDSDQHSHCLICNISINVSKSDVSENYGSESGCWLCEYCYTNLIKDGKFKDILKELQEEE